MNSRNHSGFVQSLYGVLLNSWVEVTSNTWRHQISYSVIREVTFSVQLMKRMDSDISFVLRNTQKNKFSVKYVKRDDYTEYMTYCVYRRSKLLLVPFSFKTSFRFDEKMNSEYTESSRLSYVPQRLFVSTKYLRE